MKTSETISTLSKALLSAQKQIGVALKSADNPYFKSKYADLKVVIEAVKGPLNANGLSFLQGVGTGEDGHSFVETMLLHESGEFLSTETRVYCKKPDDPQAFGSGISYSKRYALQAMLGLPTEDDDAEHAMARNGKKPKPERPKPLADVVKFKANAKTFLAKFQTAKEALAEIALSRSIPDEMALFVEAWYTEGAENDCSPNGTA